MPLVGTNFYGTQIQRTPFDDEEQRRVSARDSWNAAQHQNAWAENRFQTGRSDARAMNQDNLNFGVWREGLADTRSAAAIAAQERLAQMGITADDTRAERNRKWQQEDYAKQLELEAPERQLRTRLTTAQIAAIDAQEKARTEAQQKAERFRAALAAPGGREKFLADPLAFSDFASEDLIIEKAFELQARRDAAEAARRERLAAEAQGQDPARRTKARQQIAASPQMQAEIDLPDADPIPFQRGNIAHRAAEDAITRELTSGSIRQVLSAFSRTASADPEDDAQQLQLVGQAVRDAAARIAAETGVDARSIEADIMQQLGGMDHQSGWNAAARIGGGILSLGLSEIGDNRSQREQAVQSAFKYLGLAPITE